jgi:uncharacterized membrane protein
MISNHYAWVFGGAWNWVWLITISAAGALVRAWFVARHRGRPSPWPLVAAAGLLALTAYGVRPLAGQAAGAPVTVERVQAIVDARCVPCHAATPKFEGLAAAPKGLVLERPEQVRLHAAQIRAQVENRVMPPGISRG